MHSSDFDSFRRLLDKQAEVFSKPKPTDEMVQSYWHALRDQSLGSVEECSKRHLRYGKFFPKPFELRPRDEKPATTETPNQKAQFDAAQSSSMQGWREMLHENPELFREKWIIARGARMEVLFADRPRDLMDALAQLPREADRIIKGLA